MKLNRPPRTWSAANAAATARPNSDLDGQADSAYELGALGDALGAYVVDQNEVPGAFEADLITFLPEVAVHDDGADAGATAGANLVEEMAPIDLEAHPLNVSHVPSNVVAINSALDVENNAMTTANPMPFGDVEEIAGVDNGDHEASDAMERVAQPSMNVEALVSRLHRTRTSIADALAYCGDAADEITATAASFAAAAAQMRAVAMEQQELEVLISGAVNDLVALNDSIAAHETEAVNQAAELLAETAREAEQLRAAAVADVERARERLLQFTTDIGNVAIELQGGVTTERHPGQRIA